MISQKARFRRTEPNKRLRKSLSILLALGINLLPLQGFIPLAHASGGLNIPPAEQPQILILLDNSQGMAGVIKGPDGLSGAIMSGSGTVAEDVSSSSPPTYTASAGFTPPAQATAGTMVPYSVPCTSLPAAPTASTFLGQKACVAFGAGTFTFGSPPSGEECSTKYNGNCVTGYTGFDHSYVDNSESMFNVSEGAIRTILANSTYANNIQFGLETYGLTGGISLYNTWVYYMSGPDGFSFGPTSTSPSGSGLQAVKNPCYQSNSTSCQNIENYYSNYGYMQNLSGPGDDNGIYGDKYMYIQDTSDNPIINDVLYATASQWSPGATNVAASGPNVYGNLSNYENNQNIGVNYSNYSNYLGLGSGMTPTSAGYFPQSRQMWESQRGFGFNASTRAGTGTITVPISSKNSTNTTKIENAILPEVLSADANYTGTPIVAAAGHAPVAGAFQTAIKYFSSSASNSQNHPPVTCGKKYVIFITFGQPTKGMNHGYVYPPLGSASASTFGVTSLTSSAVTSSSTNNNAVVEAVQQIKNLYTKDKVKTYVIGVGSAVNPNVTGTTQSQQTEAQQGQYVLQAMANAGGTNTVYAASSASQVQAALNSIVANILGKSVVSSYAAPPSVTVGSLEFLLKNINPVTGQGDLFAYPVTSNGSVSSTASWTANGIMTAATRSTALNTTPMGGSNGTGSPQTFSVVASTDSAAFGTLPTDLTASDIASYTTNPSYDNGTYLGGRTSGWYVGLPSSAPAEVLTPPNNANLLSNSGYLSFAASHASRQNAVLFSDNDGFLYAIGYTNPNPTSSTSTGTQQLLWGWMPGGLLSSLQSYKAFWQGNNMGNFQSIDASPDGGTTWHTYVVGVAGGGSIYYDLQLTGKSTPKLSSVVAQYQLSGDSQPQPSAPVFYQVNTTGASNFGKTWALFAINSSNTSYLGVLNVTSGVWTLDKLPFSNTATPYINTNSNLFLGDSNGNVYEMSATNLSTVLNKRSNYSIPSTDFSGIGNYATNWTSGLKINVQFIGGTFYQGKNYLRVQGPSGITIFNQMNGTWSPVWTAYAGGAGSWKGTSYSPSSGGSNAINPLPDGSSITDQALINAGNVIVPVTIPASADTCGANTAEYFIYALNNGIFPSAAYYSTSGTPIVLAQNGGYVIGQGNALTPTVTMFNGRQLLQGAANKNTSGGTSSFPAAIGAGLPLGGPVAWRLDLTQ